MTTDENIDERLRAIEEKLNTLPIAGISSALNAMQQVVLSSSNKSQTDIATIVHAFNALQGSIISSFNKSQSQIANLGYALHSIQQTTNLSVRHTPVPAGRPIRCLFIVNVAACWGVIAPIYAAMKKASDFAPIVVTICSDELYVHEYGMKDSEEESHKTLTRLGVPHMRLNMKTYGDGLDIIKAIAPAIIFRQTSWDGAVQPAFRMQELLFARICYTSYSFSMPGKDRPYSEAPPPGQAADYHANKHFHQLCWRIFCETDMHKDMYARASMRGTDNLVSVGYTKFDELLESARTKAPVWPVKNPDGKRHFRIIWAPHFSVIKESIGFGMFQEVYKDMLAWAQQRSDVEFVLRPHQMTMGTLISHKILSQDELDAFLAAWAALPNTARYDDSDYAPFFAASDVLVTDGVGFFADYQLFRKPLIWLDSQRHTGFNVVGEMVIKSVNRVTSVTEARALCDRLQKGEPDPMRELQEKNIPLIHPFPGRAAAKILDVIREGLAEERGEK